MDTHTVLYVDPSERTRSHLKRQLADDTVDVVLAADFAAAVERFESGSVDCLVSEYNLDNRTGLELLEIVHQRDPEIPFILATDDGDERIASRAISAGVSDYVVTGEQAGYERLTRAVEEQLGRSSASFPSSRRSIPGARLRSVFDHSPDTILIHDVEGVIVDANERACETLGYDCEELLDMTIPEIEVGIDPEELDELWTDYEYGTPITVEGRHRRKDGSEFPVEVNIGQIRRDGEARFLAIARDISERKAHEEALERARQELRQIIDLVPDPIFAKNSEGEYLLANEATAENYGLTPEEVEGMTDVELLPSEEEARQFRADDLEVIESGEIKHIPEERLTTADGETRILQTTKIPYEPVGTEEQAVLGYARDVTELKEYERKLEAQRDDLELLNQVVRHDVRNDMQVIDGRAKLLSDHVDEVGEEHLREVQRSTRDVIELTRTARDLTETMLKEGEQLQPVRLDRRLEAQIETIRSKHDEAVIRTDGSLPVVAVEADEMLDTVLRNLLQNAVIHNDKPIAEIVVSVLEDGDAVVVSIADNGPGIPDDQKDVIFGKGEKGLESPGTGLGLYLVQTIIESYDGEVWVEDNDPEGAIFKLELPLAEQ